MKKEYIEPTIEVMALRTIGMLAASLPKDENDGVDNESDVLSIEFFSNDNSSEDW
jgi:hypothetical protein